MPDTIVPAQPWQSASRLRDHLLDVALDSPAGVETIWTAFCEGLNDAGLPLLRGFLGFDTLHPEIEGRGHEWRRGGGLVDRTEFDRITDANPDSIRKWHESPFFALLTDGVEQMKLDATDPAVQARFPVVADVAALGATCYLACVRPFAGPLARFTSSGTKDLDCLYLSLSFDGLCPKDAERGMVIERALPVLYLAVMRAVQKFITKDLLQVYLGADAGIRVMRGAVDRGLVRRIRAVIWSSDLHRFTALADRCPEDTLIDLLNQYLEIAVDAVAAHGGEVLKFIGDGVLAVFPVDEGAIGPDPAADGEHPSGAFGTAAACQRALDAAEALFAATRSLNRRRARDGAPVTGVRLALHIGTVSYGNIGGRGRLDFTVVGPAVNETSRLEGMCRSLDRDLVVSEAFAAACPDVARDRLVALGRYALRGVSTAQTLYTLESLLAHDSSSSTADTTSIDAI